MPENLIDLAQRALADAFYAENRGDLAEALRLYQLARGPLSVVKESEGNGIRMTLGDLDKKILELQQRTATSGGLNRIQYAGVQFNNPGCDSCDDCC